MTTMKISIKDGKKIKTMTAEFGEAVVLVIRPIKEKKESYEGLGIKWLN
jgi:hypothetical protein